MCLAFFFKVNTMLSFCVYNQKQSNNNNNKISLGFIIINVFLKNFLFMHQAE